jgi:CheY-specific phosphatase CheX
MTTPSKTALKTAMTTSISEVLETMFFMSLELSEEKNFKQFLQGAPKNLFASRLDFSGPISGYYLLFVPQNVLTDMATNFMGLEADELGRDHLHGTIKEITNMIAGNSFSHYDDQAVFKLEIPEIVDLQNITAAAENPGENDQFILIDTLDGQLAIVVVVTQVS